METSREGIFKRGSELYEKVKGVHLRDLLKDAGRAEKLQATFDGILFDYSHEKLNDELLSYLVEEVYGKLKVHERVASMFRGEKINSTEKRAVLHTALRAPKDAKLIVDNVDVVAEVH
jgi:glucose-6-phosphate isomerase